MKTLVLPLAIDQSERNPVVESGTAAFPELYVVWHERVAAPAFRPLNLVKAFKLLLAILVLFLQEFLRLNRSALITGPGPDLGASWPLLKV